MFKKEVLHFTCLAPQNMVDSGQQCFVFLEQFERFFFAYTSSCLHKKTVCVCVKNVSLLLNDGHLSRNTLALLWFQISQLFVRLLTHEIFI